MIHLMSTELGASSNREKGYVEGGFGFYRPADYFGLEENTRDLIIIFLESCTEIF